jgi:hypothetical protein
VARRHAKALEENVMSDRPRIFDDMAGMAGGAMSVLSGMKAEAEALMRARVEDVLRRLDVVRREEMDAALEMAARARAGQEAAESRLAALEARLDALEAAAKPLGGGEPGMIA